LRENGKKEPVPRWEWEWEVLAENTDMWEQLEAGGLGWFALMALVV
jgi:hypothetical protein